MWGRAAALLLLIALSPLMIVIAVYIKCGSPGPILYRGRRIGKDLQEFYILKFRTMHDAPNSQQSPLTCTNDRRITSAGAVLRRLKFDELPQLINIIRGEMTFVGPRPEDPCFIGFFPEEFRGIFKFTPGLTSPASLYFADESEQLGEEQRETAYVKRILPQKLRIDLDYFAARTCYSDLALIARTAAFIASAAWRKAPHA